MATAKKATRAQTKKHNKRLVLRTIYGKGKISRAGIARTTGLTRPTVSAIVGELMAEQLVAEVGQKPSEGGKPATLLSVVDDARHLIGLDLANSEFRGAVVNMRGEIIHRSSKPIDDRDGDAALALVYDLLDELVARADAPLLGIGIGAPGLMDAKHGIVRTAVNLDWQDLPLSALLTARYDTPVYIVNDSHAAALAEYTFGDDRESDNLIVLKVGRGIGSGIVIGGKLFYGDGSGAGEIGHFAVVRHGEQCRCGSFGCLETVASSRALVHQAQALAQTQPDSALSHLSSSSPITTDAVIRACQNGDTAIAAIVADVGCYLGVAAAALLSVLNIKHIVIAGSLAPLDKTLLQPMRREMRAHAMNMLADETQISTSRLGSDIVILGAASLLLTEELGIV